MSGNETLKADININSDFKIIEDAPERIERLNELRATPSISHELFIKGLNDTQFFDEHIDADVEKGRLDAENGVNGPSPLGNDFEV